MSCLGTFTENRPSLQALSVGIFPYVLKLLRTTTPELQQILVFIWTKILALDKVPSEILSMFRMPCYFDLLCNIAFCLFADLPPIHQLRPKKKKCLKSAHILTYGCRLRNPGLIALYPLLCVWMYILYCVYIPPPSSEFDW